MRSVRINILNKDYVVKTDAEEDYMKQLAQFLEEKVKELGAQEISDIPYPFLLAAFKVTDDFFTAKKEIEEYRNRAKEKSRELVEILDGSITKINDLQLDFRGNSFKQE